MSESSLFGGLSNLKRYSLLQRSYFSSRDLYLLRLSLSRSSNRGLCLLEMYFFSRERDLLYLYLSLRSLSFSRSRSRYFYLTSLRSSFYLLYYLPFLSSLSLCSYFYLRGSRSLRSSRSFLSSFPSLRSSLSFLSSFTLFSSFSLRSYL